MARIKKGSTTYYVSVTDLFHWKHMECKMYKGNYAKCFAFFHHISNHVICFTVHRGHCNVPYSSKLMEIRLKGHAHVSFNGRINLSMKTLCNEGFGRFSPYSFHYHFGPFWKRLLGSSTRHLGPSSRQFGHRKRPFGPS